MLNLPCVILVTFVLFEIALCENYGLPSGDVCLDFKANLNSEFAKDCFQNLDECQKVMELLQNGIGCDPECGERERCVMVHGKLQCNCTRGYQGKDCSIEIVCMDLGNLTNGNFSCTNANMLDSTCTFQCNQDYFLNGSTTFTCLQDRENVTRGSWSNLFPRCLACSLSTISADIIFVLDESGSINLIEFKQQLTWVIDVLRNFRVDIDSGSIQVGIIIFSFSGRVAISLAATTFNTLESDIMSISQLGGGTYIGSAINGAIQEFNSNGRPLAKKVMIVVTDGRSYDDVAGPTSNAKSMGITTVGVGIGTEVNLKNILEIANDEPNRALEIDDFNSLPNITSQLQTTIEDAIFEDCF